MKDHGKMVDYAVDLLSQGMSGLSEAKIIASLRKMGKVDTKEAVQILKDAKIKLVAEPKQSEIDLIIEGLDCDIQYAQTKIDEWAEEFKKDPAYKIGWMHGIASIAADLHVKKDLRKGLEGIKDRMPELTEKEIMKKVYLHFQKKVLRRAEQTHNSTSPYSNALEYELNTAYAKLIGSFGYLSKYNPYEED